MTTHIYMPPARSATKTEHSFRPNHRQRSSFARRMMFAEFGVHHGKALDQAKFADHVPGARMRLAPGSWFQR